MRNFSKTLISMAAVMAVGSAMAAGAMAAMTATYVDTDSDNVNDSVKIEGSSSHGSSQTMLIVAGESVAQYAAADAAETDRVIVGKDNDTYTASESTIKQIDQIDNVESGVAAFNKDVVVGVLADGNYQVRVNGVEGTVEEYTFTVDTLPEEPEEPKTKPYIIGDTNVNGELKSNDLTFLARYFASFTTGVGKINTTLDMPGDAKIIVGDTNANGELKSNDLTFLARYFASFTTGVGKINTTVDVIAE